MGQQIIVSICYNFLNSGASLGNITPMVVAFLPFLFMYEIRIKNEGTGWTSRFARAAGSVLLIRILIIFTIVEVRYVMFLWVILFLFAAEIIASATKSQNIMIKGLAICSLFVLTGYIFSRSIYVSLSTYSPINSSGNPICFDFSAL